MKLLEIRSGAIKPYEILNATYIDLPGGKKTDYAVYTVGEIQNFKGRETLPSGRIAHVPGTNVFYYSPNHYKPTPELPNGWVKLRFEQRQNPR
jgi:hypothetical protein